MKLYGHDTSPYVRRVRALLLELGVPFERDVADWLKPSADFLKASPIGRLPALVVRENGADLTLFDSKTIAGYLLAEHAPKAASADELPLQASLFSTTHRFADENVLTAIDTALDSAIALFIFERDGIERESAPYLLRQAARIDNCLAWLDTAYAGRTTLHDGTFGFVDLGLACCLDWLAFRKAKDFSDHSNLAAFYERNKSRASLVATDPRGAS